MQLSSAIVETAFARFGLNIQASAPTPALESAMLRIYFDRVLETLVCSVTRGRASASVTLDPLSGLHPWHMRHLASGIDLPTPLWEDFTHTGLALYRCFVGSDALECTIAPLVLAGNRLIIGGGVIDLDVSARFRQPDLIDTHPVHEPLIVSPGTGIAAIANGTGLLLAAIDALSARNLVAGPLIEMTAPLSSDLIRQAIARCDDGATPVLLNLFCDGEGALALLPTLLDSALPHTPLVIRLAGQDAPQAVEQLQQSGLSAANSLSQAIALLHHALNGSPEPP